MRVPVDESPRIIAEERRQMPRCVVGEALGVEQPGPLHILHIVSHNHDAVTAHRQAVSAANRDLGLYYAFVRAFTAVHHGQVFPAARATDGPGAVFAHGAVLTAATAIHDATLATGLPDPDTVRDHLYALTGNAVASATGRFGIDPATGNRTTAPISVHRLDTTP